MDDPNLEKNEFSIGDVVAVSVADFSSEPRTIKAEVVDVRWILGKLSYVIEGHGGKRKVVSPKQVRKLSEKDTALN